MRHARLEFHVATTRRSLLRRSLVLPATGLTIVTVSASRSPSAQTEVSKAEANYQDNPKDGQRCAGCRYFSAPNQCSIVKGEVAPEGWCRFWRAA
ncbi:MAG TPA: high-potential iron-sulfur protein [Falsiroseomonas sp.]|jgi:hypothetical protein|nr:high-potential iron-sulfur protein [Falsiroseomonas sp.]